MIFVRLARTPDASAATSELRTASIARPDAERCNAWMARVRSPKSTRNTRIWSWSWLRSSLGWSPSIRRSWIQLRPGMSSVGARIVHPS